LAAAPTTAALFALLTEADGGDFRTKAERVAKTDAVSVIVCNASRPDGSGGSVAVRADGTVLAALDDQDGLVTVDLLVPVLDLPLADTLDRPRLDQLDIGLVSAVRHAIAVLISESTQVRKELEQRKWRSRSITQRIRGRWDKTTFAAVWSGLSREDRGRLIHLIAEDAAVLLQREELEGLPLVEALRAWAKATPVVNIEDASHAIKRRALASERQRALSAQRSVDLDEMRREFWVALAKEQERPSSVLRLTQPYVQAMARNFLRNQARKSSRDSVRSELGLGATLSRLDIGLESIAERVHDLSADLQTADTLIEKVLSGASAEEIASSSSLTVEGAERLRLSVRNALRRRLTEDR
jgi:hypothetical protein